MTAYLTSRKKLLLTAFAAATAMLAAACGNDDPTATTQSGPLSFPYILSGSFTVDGEPGPVGSRIFTKINGKQSGLVSESSREGVYSNVIAGANSPDDFGEKVTIHLGDPNGDNVEAEESFTFNPPGSAQFLTMDLTFPREP